MAEYSDLDALKAKLNSLRPLDGEKIRAVREKFRLEWTYHSNAIEGNPLTLSETSFFVREGLTSKGRPLSAYVEARNHVEALNYLDSVVSERTPITEHLIRQYHTMLFQKIDRISVGVGTEERCVPIIGGQYKRENNHVIRLDGEIRQFTDWLQVQGEMERLLEWFREAENTLHPMELAAQLHHRFVSVHPFLDGNGRVSRLLLNTVLMQRGYTPAIIPVEEKKRYLEALQSADGGSYQPLYAMIEEYLSKTLRQMIDIAEGREAFDFEDLARMALNMAKTAQEIRQDLGRAIEAPELRSATTASQVIHDVARLLKEHGAKIKSPQLRVSVNEIRGLANFNIVQELRRRVGNTTTGTVQFVLGGSDRTTPKLEMNFFASSGRYQVALGLYAQLGRFDANNSEAMGPALEESVEGSIYFEDWDKKMIHDFVLDCLKKMYLEVGTEIERRKGLISTEEDAVSQYRSKPS